MELRDFVAETFRQIIDGVVLAQEYGRGKGARVNPHDLPTRDEKGNVTSRSYGHDIAHPVEFDVVVTTTEGSEKKGGIGIAVWVLKGDAGKETSTSNQSMSRIKFSVSVVLPTEKC